MGGNQRIYKQKISSTQTLKKVFRAMELIAASRIGRARRYADQSGPYEKALSQAVAAVALHGELHHPLTSERTDTNRVAVLTVTSDRGMAGAYSANILRETERLVEKLVAQGADPVLFASGRRAGSYFRFRDRELEKTWEGESDAPSVELIHDIADTVLDYFLDPDPARGVSKLYLVFTRFKNLVVQVPEVRQMLPLTVVDAPESEGESEPQERDLYPLYEFEPDEGAVLDALLPLYVESRIRNALLQAAASELASRQRAMHTATENADEIITDYTRMANAARQGEITQEITEIVSGADALSNG
ncbi:F0F1 ATP synthase subunit gamma [Gleimia hominis]|uniref:ATP synthase gamma chain n=1 Tax=Gleimia hominis TaxID=595468 RepID=A0ABU3IBV6_9ACTO|nr:F0F1 ATP synthase subunit gamma [Gleimia hominis]MDT3767406.1 F0F1 ATP synthase subunit gamma [Gleimia hominis]